MTLRDKTSTAWSNLGRRKVRTVLTSVGVIVGIMTIVTMVSLANGVRLQVKKQFEEIGLDRVTVRPAGEGGFGGGFNPFDFGGRTKIITPADVQRWQSWPQVEQASPEVDLPGDAATGLRFKGKSRPVRVAGSTSAFRRGPFSQPPTALAGTVELPQQRGVLILSRGALKGLDVPQRQYSALLGQTAEIVLAAPRGQKQSYRLKIIGISSDGAPSVQISALDRLAMKSWWFNDPNLLKTDGYDSVVLRAADVSGARVLVSRIRKEKFEVQSIDAILKVADRIFSVITIMLSMVGGLALLVACIGIVNTMIMSIYERTREIGTLKAMGASRADIRLMFMLEAGFIGLIGGVAGVFLGWLLGRGLNYAALWFAERRHLPLPDNLFVVTPALVLQSLVFAALIGILAGLYPANRAARLDPLAALRHE